MTGVERSNTADFYIEKEVCRAPLLNMHHHRNYELYYMVKGEREYFIEDRFFKVAAGDLVLLPRKVLHRTAGEGGLRYLVHFSGKFLEKFFSKAVLDPMMGGLPFVFRPEERECERILPILEGMHQEYTKGQRENVEPNETLLAGYLYQLLFIMAYTENRYVPYNYSDERITKIIQYINENYSEINDIEQIAEQFYVSKFHLCRFFKKNLGISLITYLNAIKIRQACAMIKNGNDSLTQIAMRCGFNSSSYFCKVFKSEQGISPTEYKKRHR